jgi:hypothetical protein
VNVPPLPDLVSLHGGPLTLVVKVVPPGGPSKGWLPINTAPHSHDTTPAEALPATSTKPQSRFHYVKTIDGYEG